MRGDVCILHMRIQPDDARIRNLNSELARLYHSTLTDCAAHWIIFSHQLSGGAPGNEGARRRISVFGKLEFSAPEIVAKAADIQARLHDSPLNPPLDANLLLICAARAQNIRAIQRPHPLVQSSHLRKGKRPFEIQARRMNQTRLRLSQGGNNGIGALVNDQHRRSDPYEDQRNQSHHACDQSVHFTHSTPAFLRLRLRNASHRTGALSRDISFVWADFSAEGATDFSALCVFCEDAFCSDCFSSGRTNICRAALPFARTLRECAYISRRVSKYRRVRVSSGICAWAASTCLKRSLSPCAVEMRCALYSPASSTICFSSTCVCV